jgi:hypothetical protein
MKATLLMILISGLSIISLTAQPDEPAHSREIYFSMSPIGTRAYAIQYKTGLNDRTVLRFALSGFNAGYSTYLPSESNEYPSAHFSVDGNIEAGIEKRVALTERMAAFYGLDIVLSSRYTHSRSDDPNLPIELRALNDRSISPGFGFKSGFLVNIKNGFFASAEINPLLAYTFSSNEEIVHSALSTSKTQGVGFYIRVETVKLSLVYRWEKGISK